jgi:hypothetical protein
MIACPCRSNALRLGSRDKLSLPKHHSARPLFYRELETRLVAHYRPADEGAARLVQRLASVMRRQQHADRLEAEVLEQRDYAGAAAPRSPQHATVMPV